MSFRFKIERLDPMGQGVHKDEQGVAFIPKTLPGEEGHARITESKKGVRFAALEELGSSSPLRREAECPHFQECPSCHYQHVDYAQELKYKEASLRQHLRKLIGDVPVQVHACPTRFHYRNRVQLHYDLGLGALGIMQGRKILPVPGCLLPGPAVRERLSTWYASGWEKEFRAHKVPERGHVEIYEREGQVQVSFNSAYAAGGFTQVNPHMNPVLREIVAEIARGRSGPVLDLFGGNGNLSALLAPRPCTVVDVPGGHKHMPHQRFVPLDLYSKNAPQVLKREITSAQLLLVDPPRSGLKNLTEFLQVFPVPELIYVSCWPSTMARDLESLAGRYAIKQAHLADLFPATFHYESAVYLEKT